MWIFLAVIGVAAVVGLSIYKRFCEENNQKYLVPKGVRPSIVALSLAFFVLGLFNKIFFYAEPGYIYHVRTVMGEERVIDGVGYAYHIFGYVNPWKKALTVQATGATTEESTHADEVSADQDSPDTSVNLAALNIMFLDNVDANCAATVRFRIPTVPTKFLSMAHEYRTPENLLRTALIPAFKETLQATASLMSAEDYYSGSRTEFNNEFERQLMDGIYVVKRNETVVTVSTKQYGSANVTKGIEQEEFGDGQRVVFMVEKVLGPDGQPLLKKQNFLDFGIGVVESRITDMKPNAKFLERMQLKQKASADRSIAREQRVQEEEQKLLAVTKGDREVAERQAIWRADQAEQTTKAETAKQLAVTGAQQLRETADISKQTAQLTLDRARIDAEATKVTADATAYEKRKVLEADNALAQKLAAEVDIQKIWADAYAKRNVPQYVFGAGGNTPTGSDTEATTFMRLLTMDAAKRLSYERSVQGSGQP